MRFRTALLASLCLLLVASASLCAAQGSPTIAIWPEAGLAESAVFDIEISGLLADAEYTVEIVFGGAVVFRSHETSDGKGAIAYPISSSAGDPPGVYTIRVLRAGDVLASAGFELTRAASGDGARLTPQATIQVEPETAAFGEVQTIVIAGLTPRADYIIEIIAGESGRVAYRRALSSDDAGAIEIKLFAEVGDSPGRHEVAALDADGALVAAGAFYIEGPEQAIRLSLAQDSLAAGAALDIAVTGLAAFDRVSAQITGADNTLIDTLVANASGDGEARLTFTSAPSLAEGEYTLAIFVDGESRARADFAVMERVEPTPVPTVTAQPRAIIEPVAASQPEPDAPAPAGLDKSAAQIMTGSLVDGRAAVVFPGEAGRALLITVASDDFDSAASLVGRDGAVIASNDDSRGQKDAMIGPLALPYSGEYRLEITAAPLMMPRGAEIGDFTLTMEGVIIEEIAYNASARFTLDADSPARYYRLRTQAGDRVHVAVDGGGALDPLLQIVAPNGEEIAFDDDSGAGLDAELSNLVFDRPATYTLVVSSFDGARGMGMLTVTRRAAPSLDAGEALVTLNDKAIRDLVVFEAAEDEHLVLNLRKLAGDVEDLYVTATIDGMEVMAYSTMGVPDALPLAFVSPMSGRALVMLEKFGFDDGISLALSLERP